MVCNLSVNHDHIASPTNAIQNAANTNPLPTGSMTYTQVTAHGADGAGIRDYDLTGDAGKLALAHAKTYDLDPRTGLV